MVHKTWNAIHRRMHPANWMSYTCKLHEQHESTQTRFSTGLVCGLNGFVSVHRKSHLRPQNIFISFVVLLLPIPTYKEWNISLLYVNRTAGRFRKQLLLVCCYALPSLSCYLTGELSGKIDAFLTRAHRRGFAANILTVRELFDSVAQNLFSEIQRREHCMSKYCIYRH